MNGQTQLLNTAATAYIDRYREIFNEMIDNMTSAELGDSISRNFIAQMIPHHLAAIEMSRNYLRFSNYPPLERIARIIITEQALSIDDMRAAEQVCSEAVNCANDVAAYQNRIWQVMRMMLYEMNTAYADNYISCDFLREMIPHHIGAVRMAKVALEFCICTELEPILRTIITNQERGIRQMSLLMRDLGCRR